MCEHVHHTFRPSVCVCVCKFNHRIVRRRRRSVVAIDRDSVWNNRMVEQLFSPMAAKCPKPSLIELCIGCVRKQYSRIDRILFHPSFIWREKEFHNGSENRHSDHDDNDATHWRSDDDVQQWRKIDRTGRTLQRSPSAAGDDVNCVDANIDSVNTSLAR